MKNSLEDCLQSHFKDKPFISMWLENDSINFAYDEKMSKNDMCELLYFMGTKIIIEQLQGELDNQQDKEDIKKYFDYAVRESKSENIKDSIEEDLKDFMDMPDNLDDPVVQPIDFSIPEN